MFTPVSSLDFTGVILMETKQTWPQAELLEKIAYYLETWCPLLMCCSDVVGIFPCFRRSPSVKNDIFNELANCHYKVKDEELPLIALWLGLYL